MEFSQSDKSPCRRSLQVNGYCPWREMLNILVNSVSNEKIRCEGKECLQILKKKTGMTNERDIVEKIDPSMLKPSGPSHSVNLLNQYNIEDVLEDFSRASIKNGPFCNGPFYHIKFEMRDFMKSVVSELRDIDFDKMRELGFRTFGCVLNTDYWSGPGKHWVCIFGTLSNTIKVEYFNSSSNGLDEFPELREWCQFKQQKYDIEIKEVINEEIQKSDTECGVWCLCYIKCRLENKPTDYFIKRGVVDDEITQARQYLFS